MVTQLWGAYPNIRGSVTAYDDLPDPGTPGDSYLVGTDKELYAWSPATDSWIACGSVRGPQGIQGDPGIIPALEPGELPPEGSEIGSLWWVPDDTTVEPPPPPPTGAPDPAFVGHDTVTTASVTSQSLTLPGSIASGDFAIATVVYNAGIATGTSSSGWSLHSTRNYSGSMEMKVYTKTLSGAESFAVTGATASRVAISVNVMRNVTALNSIAFVNVAGSSSSSITAPAVTGAADYVTIAGWCQRDSTTVAQSVTTPADLDAVDSAFGATGSGGAISLSIGYDLVTKDGGTVYSPGNWGPNVSSATAGHIAWTGALSVAT